jgi:hypothetical protein
VAERLKALASKASVRETVPWVRIPPSPPFLPRNQDIAVKKAQQNAGPFSITNPILFLRF